jgi:hypothetical protein
MPTDNDPMTLADAIKDPAAFVAGMVETRTIHHARPAKTTFYYQFAGDLGGGPKDPDRIWWPDQCHEVEVPVNVRQLAGSDLPADYLNADLEAAAEAICVREYKDNRHRETFRDGDTIRVYVSRSRDVPGKLYKTTLYLEPSATAHGEQDKRPVRLPTAAEATEEA